jgi:LacI family transcriptional regulator
MNQRNSRRIGIKDIASKAGVSIGTVDRVLHHRGEVKEETRAKINQIIEELGYTPNLFAQSLASKKNYRIALIVPDTSDNNPYWNKPAQGFKKQSTIS